MEAAEMSATEATEMASAKVTAATAEMTSASAATAKMSSAAAARRRGVRGNSGQRGYRQQGDHRFTQHYLTLPHTIVAGDRPAPHQS
jgi:hypothetical protein